MLKEKFRRSKGDLKKWNKEVFGCIDTDIEKRREEIKKLVSLTTHWGWTSMKD